MPPGEAQVLSPQKAEALQAVQTAIEGLKKAQQSGNFADYGAALQNLDDAIKRYNNTR